MSSLLALECGRNEMDPPLCGSTGRVSDTCGYSFETSSKPSAPSDSAGYKPSKDPQEGRCDMTL